MKPYYDVVIVGSGLAGLVSALELSKEKEVLLITKKNLEDSNSYLAQGGISICQGKSDRAAFIEDTLKAGHYKNNKRAVELLVDESEAALNTLLAYGVSFDKRMVVFIVPKRVAMAILESFMSRM